MIQHSFSGNWKNLGRLKDKSLQLMLPCDLPDAAVDLWLPSTEVVGCDPSALPPKELLVDETSAP